jgi:hypothetical protein
MSEHGSFCINVASVLRLKETTVSDKSIMSWRDLTGWSLKEVDGRRMEK